MSNNLKKFIFLSTIFLFLFLITPDVKALELDSVNSFVSVLVPADDDCGAFGNPDNEGDPAYWMQKVLDIMKYAAIVALLVLVIADFLKAIVQDDKEALKKAGITAFKRFIYCVLIFFVPIIIKIIMTFFGEYGSCNIG